LIQERISKFFEPGKEPEVAYEHRTKISGRREDALYRTVIIEYKPPKKLAGAEFEKAKEQIVDYIKEEAGGKAENLGKFFGVIIEIVKKLGDYDPTTVELEPDRVQDLFKRLYQNLVPKRVRYDLGEYFTPDWLAGLVLKEAGYDGDIEIRVLDPACGSGTFLVLAIKEAKVYAEEHFITDKRELLWKIVHNII